MTSQDSLPRALILCTDERLSRLLETELAYLGVVGRTAATVTEAAEELCLLVVDGDGFSPNEWAKPAKERGCPLLVFGREEVSLPVENGAFLRRPFILTELENTLRRLLAATAVSPPLWRAVDAPRPLREAAQPSASTPLLTVENDTVSVAGRPIPLTAAEWAIFHCLYTHRGEAVTKETLFSLLGGGGNSVEVYVCKLRTKIEKPLGKRMIWTVRGVGYRMEI